MARADDRANEARIAVITALPKEAAAVKLMLDDVEHVVRNYAGQPRTFDVGDAPGLGGTHSVVVSQLGDMGNNQAAARAAVIYELFKNVEHIIMVGIAGAVPDPSKPDHHVRLGDIVVSDRNGVVQYDLIAMKPDGSEHRGPPRPPSSVLLEAVDRLKQGLAIGKKPWLATLSRAQPLANSKRPSAEHDVLVDQVDVVAPVVHPPDPQRVDGEPRVFHGPIASADVLLKVPAKRDELRDKFKVKAVEMEGSGIADAAWSAERGYLVIRGTCDYCNPTKGDAWQEYAAVMAASYLRALLAELPVVSRRRWKRIAALAAIPAALAVVVLVAMLAAQDRAPDLHLQELGLYMVIPDDAQRGNYTEGRLGVVIDLVNRDPAQTHVVDGLGIDAKSIRLLPTGGLIGRVQFFDSQPRLVTPVHLPPGQRARVAFEYPEAVEVMGSFAPPVELEGRWLLMVDGVQVDLGRARITKTGAVRRAKWDALGQDQFAPLDPVDGTSNEPQPWPPYKPKGAPEETAKPEESSAAKGNAREGGPAKVINQHMENSPNGIQAGGDVIINKAPPGRTISNDARVAFLDALKGTTGCVIVQSFTGNTEAADFNHEIAEAFRAASWVVTDFGPSFTFFGDTRGIVVKASEPAAEANAVKAAAALEKLGGPVKLVRTQLKQEGCAVSVFVWPAERAR